jgi:hypothetical protein
MFLLKKKKKKKKKFIPENYPPSPRELPPPGNIWATLGQYLGNIWATLWQQIGTLGTHALSSLSHCLPFAHFKLWLIPPPVPISRAYRPPSLAINLAYGFTQIHQPLPINLAYSSGPSYQCLSPPGSVLAHVRMNKI